MVGPGIGSATSCGCFLTRTYGNVSPSTTRSAFRLAASATSGAHSSLFARGDLPGAGEPMCSNVYKSAGETFRKPANPYPKGASILHMLRRMLGDKVFFAGVRIVGLEPSSTAVLRWDITHLVGTDDARTVAAATVTLAELLADTPGWEPPNLAGTQVIAREGAVVAAPRGNSSQIPQCFLRQPAPQSVSARGKCARRQCQS